MGRSVIISWVTPAKKYPNTVSYWEDGKHGHHGHKHMKRAITTTYKYYNYTSGFIHHATIKRLKVKIVVNNKITIFFFFSFF